MSSGVLLRGSCAPLEPMTRVRSAEIRPIAEATGNIAPVTAPLRVDVRSTVTREKRGRFVVATGLGAEREGSGDRD